MDGVLVVLGLVALAIPLGLIILIIAHVALRNRVLLLERRIAEMTVSRAAVMPSDAVAAAPADEAPPAPEAETAPVPDLLIETAPQAGAEGEPAPLDQNQPIVLRADRASAFGAWMRRNWVYTVSAASLALAGVFLVQYGVQNGLLPPAARVLVAMVFGAALIVAAEWLRRRSGDDEGSSTAYLPSVFAGAGLVAIFAATVAARQLYDLIGPLPALVLHVATAAVAVGLGWFYGPLLVAVGLIGATAAPFLVGSGSAATPLLYAYFALVAATGLAVDAIRRWAWVSALALVLGYAGGFLMLQFGAGELGWQVFVVGLAVLAIALPVLSLVPEHPGPTVLSAMIAKGAEGWPVFPARLAAGSVLVSSLALMTLPGETASLGLSTYQALTVLALLLLLWADRAEGLADLALLPAAALPLRLALDLTQAWPLSQSFLSQAIALRAPESAPPLTVTWLALMAGAVSAAFALRALRGGPSALFHALAAVLVAPVALAVLELFWQPALVLGPWGWSVHAMSAAAAMVALAERYARKDGADHRRAAYATLSALALIALSLFVLTTATALTLSLAVLVAVAAALDQRFTLREMGVFIQIAVVVLGYRLVVDPGIDWALHAPLLPMLLAFAGAVAAEVAALVLLSALPRPMTKGVLESAAPALVAVLFNVLVARALVGPDGDFTTQTSHSATLHALPWLAMSLVQLYRANLGGPLRRLRLAVASLAGVAACAGLFAAVGPLNPLFASPYDDPLVTVIGPLLLDTLALAYAMPGLILMLAAFRVGLPARFAYGLLGAGAVLMALYAGLEIRRFWQGDFLGQPGVLQNELYSYTVALTLLGAGLLYQAIARRSVLLRRIGMAIITLTIAKVFLLDASGLSGLTRVFSFLGLGLSLAGLAWLNRWAELVSRK
ncbi:DUF2339 domain-containing protein [bacterium]|nr:DUF2339 domain-containing protein [bacterium]